MQVIIDEIVTEVVVEPGPEATEAVATLDAETLREVVLQVMREELEHHERHEDGPTWR